MHRRYQPINASDSSLYINTSFNKSPSYFNSNTIHYIPDNLTDSLNYEKSYTPNYNPQSVMYPCYTEMATDSNTVSCGNLYTPLQQSPDFECYQPVGSVSQFTSLSQTIYSNDDEYSSLSSMDPIFITGTLCGSPINVYPTKSIHISCINPISSSDSHITSKSNATSDGTKSSGDNHKTQLKTPKNSADNKMDKLLKNREAAAKCRKKKREYLKATKTLIESITKENYDLEKRILSLRTEIVDMKLLLASSCSS